MDEMRSDGMGWDEMEWNGFTYTMKYNTLQRNGMGGLSICVLVYSSLLLLGNGMDWNQMVEWNRADSI
jgi:hypothetical protein